MRPRRLVPRLLAAIAVRHPIDEVVNGCRSPATPTPFSPSWQHPSSASARHALQMGRRWFRENPRRLVGSCVQESVPIHAPVPAAVFVAEAARCAPPQPDRAIRGSGTGSIRWTTQHYPHPLPGLLLPHGVQEIVAAHQHTPLGEGQCRFLRIHRGQCWRPVVSSRSSLDHVSFTLSGQTSRRFLSHHVGRQITSGSPLRNCHSREVLLACPPGGMFIASVFNNETPVLAYSGLFRALTLSADSNVSLPVSPPASFPEQLFNTILYPKYSY